VKGHYTDKAPESALYRQSGYAGVNTTVLSTCVSLRKLLLYSHNVSPSIGTSLSYPCAGSIRPASPPTSVPCSFEPRKRYYNANTYAHKPGQLQPRTSTSSTDITLNLSTTSQLFSTACKDCSWAISA